jgi:hypothetical protein
VLSFWIDLGLKRVEKKTDHGVQRRLGALLGVSRTEVAARLDGAVNNLFPKEFIMSFSQCTVIGRGDQPVTRFPKSRNGWRAPSDGSSRE